MAGLAATIGAKRLRPKRARLTSGTPSEVGCRQREAHGRSCDLFPRSHCRLRRHIIAQESQRAGGVSAGRDFEGDTKEGRNLYRRLLRRTPATIKKDSSPGAFCALIGALAPLIEASTCSPLKSRESREASARQRPLQ